MLTTRQGTILSKGRWSIILRILRAFMTAAIHLRSWYAVGWMLMGQKTKQLLILINIYKQSKKQFSLLCCSVTKSWTILCKSMDCSTSCFPAPYCLLEFAQVNVHGIRMPSNHLILCCPLLLLLSIFPRIKVFFIESAVCIRWPSIGASALALSFQWVFRVPLLPCISVGRESTRNAGDSGLIPASGEGTGYPLQHSWASLVDQLVKNISAMWEIWVWSPGEGNSYPLQYSALESSMDCIVHEVTKSQTRLNDFNFTYTLLT